MMIPVLRVVQWQLLCWRRQYKTSPVMRSVSGRTVPALRYNTKSKSSESMISSSYRLFECFIWGVGTEKSAACSVADGLHSTELDKLL